MNARRTQPAARLSPAVLVAVAVMLSAGTMVDASAGSMLAPARVRAEPTALRDRAGVAQFIHDLADAAREFTGPQHHPASLLSQPWRTAAPAPLLVQPRSLRDGPPLASSAISVRQHLLDLPPPAF